MSRDDAREPGEGVRAVFTIAHGRRFSQFDAVAMGAAMPEECRGRNFAVVATCGTPMFGRAGCAGDLLVYVATDWTSSPTLF